MKGIWFDNIHSYADLNLLLSKTDIPPAKAKTHFIDITGGDGSLDLTAALGDVKFEDRECKFTFSVFPQDDFETKKRDISNLLNGVRCEIVLDKDPDYKWVGRCTIDSYACNKMLRQIVVAAKVAPYKLKTSPTVVTVKAGTDVVVNLRNGRKKVVPTFTCTEETTVIYGGNTFTFGAGTHKNLNIQLTMGINTLTVTSTGTVEITYQEGDL